jgi:hypothetical protein
MVKFLYGHQAGAEIGYDPVKPGRPSHVVHTYWISNPAPAYNTTSGALYYDAQGNAGAMPVQIALLGARPGLTSLDFVLI